MADPSYEQYQQLRADAARTMPRFTSQAHINTVTEIVRLRGFDWATSVLGRPYSGLRSTTGLEAQMLVLAHEQNLTPDLPASVVEARRVQDARQQQERARVEALTARDTAAWEAALAGSRVPLEVRANVHGRRYRTGTTEALRHAVPLTDAYTGEAARRRVHAAGRALCESSLRSKPLTLTEPLNSPATCVRCLAYAGQTRPE